MGRVVDSGARGVEEGIILRRVGAGMGILEEVEDMRLGEEDGVMIVEGLVAEEGLGED
jgi:hypothetical protein